MQAVSKTLVHVGSPSHRVKAAEPVVTKTSARVSETETDVTAIFAFVSHADTCVFDGAGRVRRSRTEHPGSTGGWSATQTEYDILGRTYRTSVPTEVSVSGTTWTATGDDYTRGWIWNYTYYDWKGRTVRTVPSDSTGSDGKDTLISYAGCGCAGGMTTTIEGPSVPRDDTSGNARRKQKITEDILGRNVKTESSGGTVRRSTLRRSIRTTGAIR